MIRKRSPTAAELQHPRQHADIHVDRAIGDAGVVTGALEVSDRRAVIAESGTSPKCFLTMLSRSSSSSIVRAEHGSVWRSGRRQRRPTAASVPARRPGAGRVLSIISRSRRVATRRFVVPRRLR